MDESQKAHHMIIGKRSGSIFVTIPSTLATKIGLHRGDTVLVGESDGLIIIKPTESKLAKKDLRVTMHTTESSKNKPAEKPKYDNPLDDPDFNPLDRLEIK